MTTVEFASPNDLDELKRIAHRFRKELGYIIGPILKQGIAERRIVVARVQGVLAGFIHFRHKKDLTTKIYQICVETSCQRSGVGTAMMEAIVNEAREKQQHLVSLYCPEDLDANKFYESNSFARTLMFPGRKRSLVEWTKALN